MVQAKHGEVQSNTQRHGTGYDAYINTATLEGVDCVYEEFHAQGVKILSKPHQTAYGSYEFVIEDVDGRQIGIGRIYDDGIYFENSDLNVVKEKQSSTTS